MRHPWADLAIALRGRCSVNGPPSRGRLHAPSGKIAGRGRTDSNEVLDARCRELMATLHGERGREGFAAPGNAVTGELYPAAIRYGYGELWFRPGLTHRQRMLCALASFTVIGLERQLGKFAASALNVGLTRAEIVEAVIQTGPYGGFLKALNGLAILSVL